jgi:isopenicillin-N N-acyltransferase-like protein
MNQLGQAMPPAGPPLIAVEGSYPQMGAELGRRTRDLVERSLDTYQRRFRDEAGLGDDDVRRWGARYHQIAHAYDPRIARMLEGLAEGAAQPVEQICALNARTELLFGAGYRDEGCTSIAVLPEHTASGHTLLAQNWDWQPQQGPVTFLLATRDEDGHEVLTLAEAGMLAKSGLSSAGLGVCANLLVSDKDRGGEGVPYHFLLRGVLQAPRMSVATRQVLDVARISSGNLLIADAGGEAIDFEVAPGAFGYLLPEDGVVTHANHFASDIPVRDLKVAGSALTLLRAARSRRLMLRSVARGTARPEDIVEVLRDHYSFPDSICRHPDPDQPENEAVASVYSIVMDLDARELYIASHSPCAEKYARWRLSEVFSPSATATTHFPPEQREGNVA